MVVAPAGFLAPDCSALYLILGMSEIFVNIGVFIAIKNESQFPFIKIIVKSIYYGHVWYKP